MRHRVDRIAFVVCGAAAVALAVLDLFVRRSPAYAWTTFVPQVLAGTYEAPFIYRPLAPWIVQSFTSFSGLEPATAFAVLRLAGIFAGLSTFFLYLRHWYAPGPSLAGVMLAGCLLPFTMTNSWPVPGTYLELACFSLGCLAIAARQDAALVVLVGLASLNRETSAFLCLLWLVHRASDLRRPQWLARGAALGAVWLFVYAGLRWLHGFKSYKVVVVLQNLAYLDAFDVSIEPRLRLFGWFWLFMLIVPVGLAVRGVRMRGVPPFARHASLVGGIFVITSLTAASIVEPRVLVPALPLFAPAALYAITGRSRMS